MLGTAGKRELNVNPDWHKSVSIKNLSLTFISWGVGHSIANYLHPTENNQERLYVNIKTLHSCKTSTDGGNSDRK